MLCFRSLFKYTTHVFWYHNGKMITKNSPYFKTDNRTVSDNVINQLSFDYIAEDQLGNFTCQVLTRSGEVVSQTVEVVSKNMSRLFPNVLLQDLNSGQTIIGQDIKLVCNVTFYRHVDIYWWFFYTMNKNQAINAAKEVETLRNEKKFSKNYIKTIDLNNYITTSYLTISQVNVSENGYYGCRVSEFTDSNNFIWVQIYDLNETVLSFENVTKFDPENMEIEILMTAYPLPTMKWFDNHGKESVLEEKNISKNKVTLKFKTLDTKDFGNHTIVAESGYKKIEHSVYVNVTGLPIVKFHIYNMSSESATLKCSSVAYPKPSIEWFFKKCTTLKSCLDIDPLKSKFRNKIIKLKELWNENYGLQIISYVSLNLSMRGVVLCRSMNSYGRAYAYEPVLGFDTDFEMSIESSDREYSNKTIEFVGQKELNVICATSKPNKIASASIVYEFDNYKTYNSMYTETKIERNFLFSSFFIATLSVKSPSNSYHICSVLKDGFLNSQTVHVESRLSAYITISRTNMMDSSVEGDITSKWRFYCYPEGFPTPTLKWYKNDQEISNSDKLKFMDDGQILEIVNVVPEDEGIYKCKASNTYSEVTKSSSLNVVITNIWMYVQIILVICALLFIALLAFIKFKKEKKIHKKLKLFGLFYSQKNSLNSINPKLSIEDQATLLPFNQKWEIPAEKIIIGKQLGSGAFGITFEANVLDYFPDDRNKTVAVKTVNSTSGFECVKALISELKILSHLGCHVNIVNFLGACTRNIVKDELYVVLEFCSFGSLLDYIKINSQNFIDQKDYDADVFDWTNDVEDSKNENSVCSKNFIVWSFQIARGMEYLGFRRVVHGDLAARNVLLTDQNVVKVCDFGLAKNVYNYGNYIKKSQGLLPIKWMAIEAIEKGIFSTQSDVWSFGVVLWEIFTLGKTPYFGVTVDENFCERLIDGYRMEQPRAATSKIYQLMLDCWELDPVVRPSFTDLGEQIGSLLEDPVKNYYISMNSGYILMNKKRFDEDLDYLTMVNEPTYQNVMSKFSGKL